MYVKKQTVLPAGVKVTKCAPGVANATPIRNLRDEWERHADLSALGQREADMSERNAEIAMETYGAARLSGMSVSDALDEAGDAVYRSRGIYRRR